VISEEQLESALAEQRSRGGLLGEILTARGWVTSLSLAAALARQRDSNDSGQHTPASRAEPAAQDASWKPLGTLLVERGFLSLVELRQALAEQQRRGGFLGQLLVERGWISAADLVLALAAQLGLDFDVKRAASHGVDGATILPADRPAALFQVFEGPEGARRLLETAETFLEATDFVFDQVLCCRQVDELQIVRIDAGRREVVWEHRPDQQTPTPQRDDLQEIFGYPVTEWQDSQTLYDR